MEEDPELREKILTRKDEKKFTRERSTTTREQGVCFTLRETEDVKRSTALKTLLVTQKLHVCFRKNN